MLHTNCKLAIDKKKLRFFGVGPLVLQRPEIKAFGILGLPHEEKPKDSGVFILEITDE